MLIERVEMAASLEAVADLRAIIRTARDRLKTRVELLDDLALVVSEIATNSVRHGQPPAQCFTMELHVERASLRVDFLDDGGPFRDFARRWADSSMAPLDPMAESGRGLWLVRNSVDRFAYERDDADQGGLNRWSFWRNVIQDERPAMLLIEDDEMTRGLFVSILAKIGRVTCAGTLAEAADMLKSTPFDLVIADYNLGDGSMAELLACLRNRDAEPDMPIIFVTGDRTGAARVHGLEHGIHAVLQKPVRPRELQERASEAMAAHRAHMVRAARRLERNVKPLIDCANVTAVPGFRLVARGGTASAGGGDIFATVHGGQGRKRFVLADCAGHGMTGRIQASALSGLMSGISASAAPAGGPDSFLNAVSSAIHGDRALEGLVATMIVIDLLEAGTVELATGGHPAPYLVAADGSVHSVPLSGALPGLLPSTGCTTRQVRLGEGERMFLATDGLAPDSTETLEGVSNAVARGLAATSKLGLADAADRLAAIVTETLGVYPADDWTFVLVEASGFQPAAA